MGLLDEAIREHLELKRRRGADASEVSREETEALGPVRHGAGPRVPADDGSEQSDLDGHAATGIADPLDRDAGGHEDAGHGADDEDLIPATPGSEPEPEAVYPQAGHLSGEEPPAPHETVVPAPEPAAPTPVAPAPEPLPSVAQPTIAFDVSAELASEPPAHPPAPAAPSHPPPAPPDSVSAPEAPPPAPAAGQPGAAAPVAQPSESAQEHKGPTGEDDVLEETPEFLAETPEHDRLWFEQRPPRDFDFDK